MSRIWNPEVLRGAFWGIQKQGEKWDRSGKRKEEGVRSVSGESG